MPAELTSLDQLKAMLKQATEVRIVRKEEQAKVKVRTRKGLFTFKTTGEQADTIVKGLKIPVVEF